MMRILLISRSFNKHGGISRYVAELAERFVKEHETHLLTTKYDYKVENLIVHKKPIIEKPFWLQILSNAYYNTKYAKKLKEKFNIDVVHSNGAESLFCDVVTMHDCHRAWDEEYRSWGILQVLRSTLDLTNRYVLYSERKLAEKSKKIITISNNEKRRLLRFYDIPEEKIVVIPNGVNVEEFKFNVNERRKIRSRLRIEDNEVVLMFAGHEFRKKGLEIIIKALPMVKEDVKLLVIGGDNPVYYKKLASKIGVLNKIVFLGLVPDIKEYYAASDIFVFPSLHEGFGLVITEAMSSGLPVITTKLTGASELIIDGYNGILLNEVNSEELARKINLLIEDEKLRKQIGKNARKTAEKYTWDETAKKTLEVYEEVAKR
ncbi:MAG: glycosyltransferase family 4 protein [Candidatus Methanospirare jalkutatii]|nr:MAG: glycosyltransferase family 4 protein [Candidatus Methanospirare jalkutatii]UYZ40681.1 MAG: glycosyltransferase family 4 protein [Candidatus Methanospirare jalkutatii]